MIEVFAPNYLEDDSPAIIGTLKAFSAVIHNELDADYYCSVECPISQSVLFVEGNVLRMKDQVGNLELFRLSNVEKNGFRLRSQAYHISRDLKNYQYWNFNESNKTAQQCITLISGSPLQTPFTLTCDIPDSAGTLTLQYRNHSLWELLEVIREHFGGHFYCHGTTVHLTRSLGTDRGMFLRYGKNIKSFTLKEDWSDVCTEVMPHGKVDSVLINTTNHILTSAVQYDNKYSKSVKFDQDIEQAQGESQEDYYNRLRADLVVQGTAYLVEHHEPIINYTIDAMIDNQAVSLNDDVKIKYDPLSLDFTTNIVCIEWDNVSGYYNKIEFGSLMKNIRGLYQKLKG